MANPFGNAFSFTENSADEHCSRSKRLPSRSLVGPHSSPFPMLDDGITCTKCAQLSYEQLCTPEGQRYHEGWTSIIEKAAQGCQLCTFFMTAKGCPLKTPGQSGSLFLRIRANYVELFGSGSNIAWTYKLCLPADIEPLPELAKNIKDRLRYPDRSCENAINKIQKWTNECDTAHPTCRKPTISSLPSRVLSLPHEGSSQTIRLVEGKGRKAEYITLSYCWGKEAENANGQITTCTSQNIHQLFQGVSIDVLPPLYRDAVIMTQKLGKRYLWIDSLCIIQDSKDDWAKECPRMADIYANSFLTISAASCRNKQEGFIKATVFEIQAKLTSLPGTKGQYIHIRAYFCSTPPTPLMDRAWAFQERLLSTRVLHLTSLEMLLQCDKYESGGCGNNCSAHGCGRKSFLWKSSWSPFEGTDPGDVKNIWYRAVENYAHLGLTYGTDRLPALSSVAHLMQQRFLEQDGLRARYVAGLWEHDLAYGLLWSAYGSGKTKAKEPSPYVAPTWTWVSAHGQKLQTDCMARRDLLKLSVVEVEAQPSTSNSFGEISSAYLTVDAPLRQVFTKDIRTSTDANRLNSFTIYINGFPKSQFRFDNGNEDMSKYVAFWLLPCVTDGALEDQELQRKSRLVSTLKNVWDGLVLELVDEKKQVYKRIGVFGFSFLFGDERTWSDLGFVDTRVTII